VTELELPELREVPKAGGLGRGPVGGGRDGASNVARRSMLASSIPGVSAINSRILSQVPWTPRGYSSPFVSTHRNHNRAIRLHTFTLGHTYSYDLICCCSNTFLSDRVDGNAISSASSSSASRIIWRAKSRLVRACLRSSFSVSSATARNSTSFL